jgi:hypothetical protein
MLKPKKPFESKQPISINEGFTCLFCGKHNPKAAKTCRNHCRNCLYSRHVDAQIPGDRNSTCYGLMEPIYINQTGKKGMQIIHYCLLCGKKATNKTANDDNPEQITKVIQRQNIDPITPSRTKTNAKR